MGTSCTFVITTSTSIISTPARTQTRHLRYQAILTSANTPTMKKSTSYLLAVLSVTAIVFGSVTAADSDVCGDPLPTDAMRQDPQQVLDWLRQRPLNQRIMKSINEHPFLRDAEAGKLEKNVMQRYVINTAYLMERCVRALHTAQARFGQLWPKEAREGRELLTRLIDFHEDAMDDLAVLGAKFDVDSARNLLVHDPDYIALVGVNGIVEAVHFGQDLAEVVAPIAAVAPQMIEMHMRLRKALYNPAYKAWGIGERELKFFDYVKAFNDENVFKMTNAVLRRAIDRDITLCQLRRRTEMDNIGRRAFLDGTAGINNPQVPAARSGTEGF